jgi:hypothetical protein
MTAAFVELGLPPLGVLDCIGVDSLVRPAVNRPVSLIVTTQIDATYRYPALRRVFPDRGQDGVAVYVDRRRRTDVYRSGGGGESSCARCVG